MSVFITTLKRIFKKPLNLLFIALFPILLAILIALTPSSDSNPMESPFLFGVADQDQTTLSQTLVKRLETRFNIVELSEEEIAGKLTEQDVPWALVIREGYQRDLLEGKVPVLDGYSLTISDVSALGSAAAENITRALLLLGTDDEDVLSAWEETSAVTVTSARSESNWGTIAFWFGFFGFISMYTAYFIVRTMMDDKKGGMPDRLGVLPHSPRSRLTKGVLAVFIATECTVLAVLVVIQASLGEIPNAPYLFLLLSLYNLFSVGMALSIFSVMGGSGATGIAITMLTTFIAMLGGLFWPLEFVPEFMRKLAWFSPGYWLSRGLGGIREIDFENYGMPLLFLSGFTILTLLLGGVKRTGASED